MTQQNIIDRLASHFEVDTDDINQQEWTHYGLPVYNIGGGQDVAIGTDAEADLAVAEYISETLWAFTPSFLAQTTGLDQKIFDAFVKADLCEDANDALRALVDKTCGIDRFVLEAILADTRGHLLASYDGEEIEIMGKNSEETLFAYKI